ncbi:g10795 [Coccomyxa elongata]
MLCSEGLLCSPDVADPLWYKAKVAPDFVELWNQPMPPNIGGLQKNVVDCIEQVVDYIIHQALSTDGICAPWEPLPHHLPSLLRSEGPASRTRSRTASQQTPPSNRAEASSDSGLDVDLLPGSTSAQGKAAMRLARAAAAFERDWVMGFLGAGALGEVLWGRMPCGRKVALKVAACGYRKEEMLRNEAKAYLAVQHLWNKGVPELLLAGELRAVGGSYGLGTSVLPGRPLQPGDAELLPAALAILKQIHSKGVIHGDLRPENFMAMEPDVAKGCADKTIFVLDFTHCTFDKRKKTQRSEICNLQSLFESL